MLNYFGDGVYSDSNDPIIKQHNYDGRDLPKSVLDSFKESDIKKVSFFIIFVGPGSIFGATDYQF